MPATGNWQYFPKTHLLAIATVLVGILIFAGSSQQKQNKEVTHLLLESPEAERVIPDPVETWEQAELKSGDNLSLLFTRENLSAADMLTIARTAPRDVLNLQPGQIIKWQRTIDNHVSKILTTPLS